MKQQTFAALATLLAACSTPTIQSKLDMLAPTLDLTVGCSKAASKIREYADASQSNRLIKVPLNTDKKALECAVMALSPEYALLQVYQSGDFAFYRLFRVPHTQDIG